MAEAEPAAKKARQAVEPSSSTDEARWTEVFWMLHDGGQIERGPHYALTIANLKKRADDIDAQVEALRQAEGDLLKAASAEVLGHASEEVQAPPDSDRGSAALTWGRALAKAVEVQAGEAARFALLNEPLDAPTQLSIEAQQCAQAAQREQAEAKRQAEAERQAQQAAQAEQLLAQQAAAMRQAQAMAERQAQVLAEQGTMAKRAEMLQRLTAMSAGGGRGASALNVRDALQALAGRMGGQATGWNNQRLS